MKNVTFRIDENLIQKARAKAIDLNKSLNELFVEWLTTFSNDNRESLDYKKYISKYSHIKIKEKYSRDQMNER
ncbi:antitoxin [Leptospira koniambonensis]|uniref:Antitoxin n=1 Tax=Leptospira koniambonensis TaxID=2484950 RepID=A0A4R9J3D3_9LEPT|nr:antitoxin [Leptospira koniambonensis]TGL31539.1 antitoxin [Leptospira koniambonensis]